MCQPVMVFRGQESRDRKPLSRSQQSVVVGAVFLGCVFVLSSWFGYMSRVELQVMAGTVTEIDRGTGTVVTVTMGLENNKVRLKFDANLPGFERLNAAIANGQSARFLVDARSLTLGHTASIYQAEIDGLVLVSLEETIPPKNHQIPMMPILGPVFCLIGFAVWHKGTAPDPSPREVAAYNANLDHVAAEYPLLFRLIRGFSSVSAVLEKIPILGTILLLGVYVWLLPFFLVLIQATASSNKRLLGVFCFTYWVLLAGLFVSTLFEALFPGVLSHAMLTALDNRFHQVYVILNMCYLFLTWIWIESMWEWDIKS
jgi:hypothetical protein